MKIKIALFLLLTVFTQYNQAQIGRLRLSPTEETTIKIANNNINLSYSRPSIKGRKIFGSLVPYDKLWRTGANRNTTIEFSEDVIINKKRVSKGKYAIFSKPNLNEWEIIFYNKTDNWDVPKIIDSTNIVATIKVNPKKLDDKLEVLSISIGDFTNYKFNLNIAWETTQISIPIDLVTKEIMEKKIFKTLNGPNPHDFYAAAVYEMESGKNFERGLKWINSAIKIREELSFWDLRVKAIFLTELNRKKEATKVAEKGLEIALKENHEYGINEMRKILSQLKK